MKESEETLTVIVFRGARANPWRLKIRKAFVKHGLIWGLALLLIGWNRYALCLPMESVK